MGKQHKLKQQRRTAKKLVIVKTTWTDPQGQSHEDVQLLDVYKSSTLEQIRNEVLGHAQSNHPECTWTVEVFDADDIPPEAFPGGLSFTGPLEIDF